jgi:hypothetical protein
MEEVFLSVAVLASQRRLADILEVPKVLLVAAAVAYFLDVTRPRSS